MAMTSESEAWLKRVRARDGNGELSNLEYKEDRSTVCSRRTLLEKILFVLLAVAVSVLLVVAIFLVLDRSDVGSKLSSATTAASSQNSRKTPDVIKYKDAEICLSQDCVSAAARIDSNIDYSVSPCDDLYQFACGRWLKKNIIEEDHSSKSFFLLLSEDIEIVLRILLEEDPKPSDLESVKKAKTLYASCLDVDAISKRGDQVYKDMLLTQIGGWPITHAAWDESSFDLSDSLIKVNQLSIQAVFKFYVGLDSRNSSKRTLILDQPAFGMPGQKYYLVPRDDKTLVAYEQLVLGVANLMGVANPETAEQDVKDLVDFEIRLANISVADEKRRDINDLYNLFTLDEVHGNYSQILDWHSYVSTLMLLPRVGVLDVTGREVIINHSPEYFSRLGEVVTSTPKRVLANYIGWRTAQMALGTQGDDYKELYQNYKKVLLGTSSERARFRQCVSYTTGDLGLAVGRMFIKENFRVEAKAMVLDMIADLRSAFNELLDDVDWMDDKTRQVAREKSEYIDPKIGYSENILNDTFLEERYKNLTYSRDKYFENVVNNRREFFAKNMRRLREPFDKKVWNGVPTTVNAFYNPYKNIIMFPAGILQPPFFSRTYPKSLNYGGIGMVIGHEITHGFDDEGRQYDKEGNLAQWWSDDVIRKFKDKKQCLVDQYSNFTVEAVGMKLNGVNTQGENIADNGGLKQSFRAYRNWVRRRGREEPLLPGLNFTQNQLFFINFAQLWCVLKRDANAILDLRVGRHSPGKFRVIGSAQNSPEFAEAFNCPKGSYMNPEKKCTVW